MRQPKCFSERPPLHPTPWWSGTVSIFSNNLSCSWMSPVPPSQQLSPLPDTVLVSTGSSRTVSSGHQHPLTPLTPSRPPNLLANWVCNSAAKFCQVQRWFTERPGSGLPPKLPASRATVERCMIPPFPCFQIVANLALGILLDRREFCPCLTLGPSDAIIQSWN